MKDKYQDIYEKLEVTEAMSEVEMKKLFGELMKNFDKAREEWIKKHGDDKGFITAWNKYFNRMGKK